MKPTIVLFGRTNVGKSTLFNRLTEAREALVSPFPGTTRDYTEGELLWQGRTATVIDTGGVETLKKGRSPMNDKVREKILRALEKADVILFLLDATSSVTALDRELLKIARRCSAPVTIAINKVDNPRRRAEASAFPSLGSEPFLISAANGAGVGDLLDEVMRVLGDSQSTNGETDADIVVTILGKPNVGKSTLLNAILGEERVIVHEQPHTTREPIDTWFQYQGQRMKITDTAGIRRHVPFGLERQGVEATVRRLEQTDVVLFLFDPFLENLTHQDRALSGMLKERPCSLIVVCNKYDLSGPEERKHPQALRRFEEKLRKTFPFLAFAPIVAIAAKDRWRVPKLLDLILTVHQQRKRVLTADELRDIFHDLRHELGAIRARTRKTMRQTPKLASLKQTKTNPPEFTLHTARHAKIPFALVKIVERHIRERAGFLGTPIKIHVERA